MTSPYDTPYGQAQPYDASAYQQPYDASAYAQQPYQASGYQQPAAYGTPRYQLGQQQYAYAAAYPAPRSPKTTLGMWALILGLSGFLLPIGLNVIAAIVLGIIGIVKEQRRGMSIAGLAIGAFVLFAWMPLTSFVWSIVLSVMLSV